MSLSIVFGLLVALSIVSAQNAGINTGEALYALRFPDVGQASVALPQSLSEVLSPSFSFEAWVMYPGTTPGARQGTAGDGLYKTIVSRYAVRPDGTYHNMYADFNLQIQKGGEINFFMGNGLSPSFYGVIITAGTLQAGRWTHLAFSVHTPNGKANPDYATLFVDGAPSNSTWKTGVRQLQSSSPINIGAYLNQDGDVKWWRGYMDEIRIWSAYRTTDEIQGYMSQSVDTNSANLLAYYKCNSGTGLVDSAHNYDGEFVSGAGSIQYQISGAKLGFTTGAGRSTSVDIVLPGVGTSPFTYIIETIPDPSVGSLKSGNTVILSNNLPFFLPGNVVTFQSANVEGKSTSFSYYGSNSAGREANSTHVTVLVDRVACKPDACGVCNGDNSTCTCLQTPYKGYEANDLERILYLYEIDQTLDLINQVEVQVDQALDALDSSFTNANLNAELLELGAMNEGCLHTFDADLAQFVDDLNQMS
eukprot:TRINITY_DN3_c0_g1_i1.p1 TRINITY_DN3_c0_g1~~TRINITY_DN3_c0_g1_i1.p1  ORF type:complete len:476 (-),score=122.88 TRINITY_DN3_c0_g1_i1:221-1648(-)